MEIKRVSVIYRISEKGYAKEKPEYINNETCLANALLMFQEPKHEWYIIADNISEETLAMIRKYTKCPVEQVNIGNGAGTFNKALDYALSLDRDDYVYFLENDYLHNIDADKILLEGLNKNQGGYVTLYDHPDKFLPASKGGNPFIAEDGGEDSKIYITDSCWWKITNSTTMTFAAQVSTLAEDVSILRHWTKGNHPDDFHMFLELRKIGRVLISSIPSFSSHMETKWLSKGGAHLNNNYFFWETVAGIAKHYKPQ